MHICFIGATPQARVYKQVKALKKRTNTYTFSLICYRYDIALFDAVFDKVYILKATNPIDEIQTILLAEHPNVIHAFSDKVSIIRPIIKSKIPYVFDPYDYFLDQKGVSEAELLCQWQEMLSSASALLLRYDKTVLNHPYFKNVELSNIPIVQLFDYCLDEFFVTPSIKDKKESSVVHIGYVSSLDAAKEEFAPSQFDSIATTLAFQNTFYTIYSSLWSDNFDTLLKSYEATLRKCSPYFQLNSALDQSRLNSTIASYMYGSYLHDIEGFDAKKPYVSDSVGNKIFNYLEAGLPIVCTSEFDASSRFIQEHSIGYVFETFKDFKLPTNTLEYEKLLKHCLLLRETTLSIHTHIHTLENIYKEIL